jgi:hypothetical protein
MTNENEWFYIAKNSLFNAQFPNKFHEQILRMTKGNNLPERNNGIKTYKDKDD